jgi:uncharacterized protein
MSNRLAHETSPYLLQHRDNPVDWYPWGSEALSAARERDLPILLSIGYSACHWCHVMERESFEDAETAALMNERFVCIKVDREERPDVDAIYMDAVQAMTGQGGWPLTAFLDTEAVPFYGGTYFPPEPRHGLPGFRMLLEAVSESWRTRRDQIASTAERIRERLQTAAVPAAGDPPSLPAVLDAAERRLAMLADARWGGFGGAPKFPPSTSLEFLMARGEGAGGIVERTLDAMACGGICDQLGGGFARYAVDSRWLVPHFEKMLYDNALLARAYLHGWQATGAERWRAVCERALDWMLREMRGAEGGFYSALDADSEGQEGRFYVWSESEARAALAEAGLGASADPILAYWGVSAEGNWEGHNILNVPGGPHAEAPEGLEAARAALLEHRAGRVRPALDDKRICSWNALAIAALADAGAVLGRADYLDAARAAASFVWERMRDPEGRLLRVWKEGAAPIRAYLEDHAYLADALLVLYEATFEARWLEASREVADTMIDRFADPDGGFFTTADDAEKLIARRGDVDDHPIPSGNSAAALGLLRLAALTGERAYAEPAERILARLAPIATQHPHAVSHLLRALDFHVATTREVALVAPGDAGVEVLHELAAVVRTRPRPHLVLAGGPEGTSTPELLAGRAAVDGRATAYVCENFACRAPVTDPRALAAALD